MAPSEEIRPVQLSTTQSNVEQTGELRVWHWSQSERRKAATLRALRVMGAAALLLSCAAFVHPLIPFASVTFVIALVVSPTVFFRRLSQEATLASAQGVCPHCQQKAEFRPYLSAEVGQGIRLICQSCGQACDARGNGALPF